mmetsp:Transcript_9898/g.13551  ORF Transcript_9898/g.13551 Transcript_9898/m.13551 type:complete len:149 (-) Transcript_9898:143-589(-)|eukprot:CAMPEP_0170116168 /NCGR_PEP_ID=MMETSP0020_2-20130122/12061_1 /TAXON_ID=98059 /ORGANISM="Dinobryon sp., Strain UTEXLB2267" /LENGTH=148 /DNA_ID=CAMNT_0010344139 /DNA_START=276 /DNA_END=722 /DNA_ORIENTATION=+
MAESPLAATTFSLPTSAVTDTIVGCVATVSLISFGGIEIPFPKLIGNEIVVIAMCVAYFVRKEDKAERAAWRKEYKAEMATLREEYKAEMAALREEYKASRKEYKAEMDASRKEDKAEMRILAFFNFAVSIVASYSAHAYTMYEISHK